MTTATDTDRETPAADAKLAELAEMIRQYNALTENLRESHESLNAEVVRLQHQLASTDAQLQRSRRLAALGEMAAGIAHEIRNPLAAIRLYAGMIAEDLEAAVARRDQRDVAALGPALERAGEIVSAVRGLDGIVNDVLTFSRELRPRLVTCDASELLEGAAAAHRPAIEAAGVAVCVDLAGAEGAGVVFEADEGLIRQAVLNLVRNAVDAMASVRDGRERQLTLGAMPLGGGDTGADGSCEQVALTVRDTGGGIAAEHVDRIFNPFFTTRSTGTGLGLAIVHRIVDAHGGTICVYNDDSGAVFELRLPRCGTSDAVVSAPDSGATVTNRDGVRA